jgi:GAF domain-containing protein
MNIAFDSDDAAHTDSPLSSRRNSGRHEQLSGVETVFRFALKGLRLHASGGRDCVFMADRNAPDHLFSSDLWEGKNLERFQELQRITRETAFKSGEGLPGSAMKSRGIETLDDLSLDPRFSARGATAKLQAGIAFPVLAGEEVAAVFEFFSVRFASLNQELLDTLLHVGTLLGRAVERQRSEEALRSSEVLFRTIFRARRWASSWWTWKATCWHSTRPSAASLAFRRTSCAIKGWETATTG